MRRPPPVPLHQRLKRILQKPPLVKLLVEPQHRNRAHRRLAAVKALPPAGPRIVGHKPLRRLLAQNLQRIRVGQVLVSHPRHASPQKTCPSRTAHTRPSPPTTPATPAKSPAPSPAHRSCPTPASSQSHPESAHSRRHRQSTSRMRPSAAQSPPSISSSVRRFPVLTPTGPVKSAAK